MLDEVSMVGCRLLSRLSATRAKHGNHIYSNKKNTRITMLSATRAKHGDPSILFVGIDVIYFADFVQFSPVKDTPLFY